MRFSTTQPPFSCGIDLQARTMDVCIRNHAGEMLVHRDMQASPETFLKAIAPYRADLVVWVECLFTWYWLADLCARASIPFVLGPALYMPAIHGGKAKTDRRDAKNIAVLLRGGMLPQASVSPAAMRATRALLRRRRPLRRTRAEWLPHSQNTPRPSNLPEMGKNIASKANRTGGAERFPEPAVQKRLAVDLAVVKTAKQHDANPRALLRTVPGIGASLSRVLFYAMHASQRFPRVQAFVAYCRLVTGAKASAGTRSGTAGTQRGHAYRPWAFSAAAVLFFRANPAGQQSRAR